jgi:uncharacterized protein YciI
MDRGPHLALIYEYVPDIVERRGPYRQAHLDHGRKAREAGWLLAAGALGDPVHSGLFIFAGEDREAVDGYARADPYAEQGLITSWRIEPWNVVI